MQVLGRRETDRGHVADFGRYLATDGSDGARVGVDVARPHVALVVGKRGSGKSYTLGVLAEELADVRGVAPVVADPMGPFSPLSEAGWRVLEPTVPADALSPRAWCGLVGLDPESGPGALVWRAAAERPTLAGMCAYVSDAGAGGTGADADAGGPGADADAGGPGADADAGGTGTDVDAPVAVRRAAGNHLRMAESWGIFGPDGLGAADLAAEPTVLALEGTDRGPANAVLRAVAAGLFDARLEGRIGRLPWLLVDEAHAFFDGVAEPALRRVLTRGRGAGVSLVAATQRPSALPDVAVSQADLLVAHRLTGEPDRAALASARPSYLRGSLGDRLPAAAGEALVFDDATERTHQVRVRRRRTEHGGASPTAWSV